MKVKRFKNGVLLSVMLLFLLSSISLGFATDYSHLSGTVIDGLSATGSSLTVQEWDIDSDGINDMETFCNAGSSYMKSINNATSYATVTFVNNQNPSKVDYAYYGQDINTSKLTSGGSLAVEDGGSLAMRLSSGNYANVNGWASGSSKIICNFESVIQTDGTPIFSSIRLSLQSEITDFIGITDGEYIEENDTIFLLNGTNILRRYWGNLTLRDSTTIAGNENRRMEFSDDRNFMFLADNRTIKSYDPDTLSFIDSFILQNTSDPYYNSTDYGWVVTDIESREISGIEYLFISITTNSTDWIGRIVALGLNSSGYFDASPYMWYVPDGINGTYFGKTKTVVRDIDLGDFNGDSTLEISYGVEGWGGSDTFDYFVVEELAGTFSLSTLKATRVQSLGTFGSSCSDAGLGRTEGTGISYVDLADYLWNNGDLFEWQYFSQPCPRNFHSFDWWGGLHEYFYDSSLNSQDTFNHLDYGLKEALIDSDGEQPDFDTMVVFGKHGLTFYELDECAGFPTYCYPAKYDNVRGFAMNTPSNSFGVDVDYQIRELFDDEVIAGATKQYIPIDVSFVQYGSIGGVTNGLLFIGVDGFAVYSVSGLQSAPTFSFASQNDAFLIDMNSSRSFTILDADDDALTGTLAGSINFPNGSSQSYTDYFIDNLTVYQTIDTYKFNDAGSYNIVWTIDDSFGNTGTGTYFFTVTNSSCSELGQNGSWSCTSFSPCYIEAGVSVKSRTCIEDFECGFTSPITKTRCDAIDLPDEPEEMRCIPRIVQPATDSFNPSINSQTPTGFGCFTNWFGFNDSYISSMTYTINGESHTLNPEDSEELCGRSESCVKHRGFVQTWDYLNDYFTEYDNTNVSLGIDCVCYDKLFSSTSTYSLDLGVVTEYENFCYNEEDALRKECFSYDDDVGNHIISSKDLNLLPSAYSDLDRAVSTYNIPDKQMYRMTTDIVNYFSDIAHINDAHDSFFKISRNQGYHIFELTDTPLHDGSVYIDLYITDIYPKWLALTNSDGKVQILILFYDNNVHYFDGFSFKTMGEYILDTPFRFGIIWDSDNQRFKAELINWFMNADDDNNIYNWKKIGGWSIDKQGTYVETTGAGDPIRYLAFTMTSELCNSDVDCSSVVGNSQSFALASSTAVPLWSDDFGFQLTENFKYEPDNQFTSYFDDASVETFSNMTADFSASFTDDSIVTVYYRVTKDSTWCSGTPDYEAQLHVYDIDADAWTGINTSIDLSVTNYDSLSFSPSVNFSQIRFNQKISGGGIGCGSIGTKGSIGVDAIRVVNVTNTDVEVGQCRDIEWFKNEFTNTSASSGQWGMSRMINNSQFMNEWGDFDINDKLNKDNTTFTEGYCYSEVLIDNIESSEKTTFIESPITSGRRESGERQIIEYEWLNRLGWRPNADADTIEGQAGSDSYISKYFDFSVCTEEGRNLNPTQFCIIAVQFDVGLDLIQEWIYGNFLKFLILLIIIIGMAYVYDLYHPRQ